MSDNLDFFPSNRREALALEYVKLHMTDETTPEDLVRMYADAYKRISSEFQLLRQA